MLPRKKSCYAVICYRFYYREDIAAVADVIYCSTMSYM